MFSCQSKHLHYFGDKTNITQHWQQQLRGGARMSCGAASWCRSPLTLSSTLPPPLSLTIAYVLKSTFLWPWPIERQKCSCATVAGKFYYQGRLIRLIHIWCGHWQRLLSLVWLVSSFKLVNLILKLARCRLCLVLQISSSSVCNSIIAQSFEDS